MKKLATLIALVAAVAVSAPVVGQARHSADDPVTHARHGADDRGGVARSPLKAKAAQVVEKRHGADDPVGHGRHGRDDGSNHA
jgi:hypothetical protein